MTLTAALPAVPMRCISCGRCRLIIDTDYYDKFFGPGDYGPAHAAHMANWLRGGRPHAYRRVMRVATRGSASVADHASVGTILMFNTGLLHGERVTASNNIARIC